MMNDNLLVVEQNSHNINYNVGDMYENYFENYTPAQLNRTVKEGARLSNIKLEYMILRNSDTNKNIIFCYFGDLFMSTSVNDYTWIIYGFIVDGIEVDEYGFLPDKYNYILLEKIINGNCKIAYHKQVSHRDGSVNRVEYYLYVQNNETGEFEGGQYTSSGSVNESPSMQLYDKDIVLYQFSFIDSNSGNKKYFVTDKSNIQKLVKSGKQKDALFISKSDVNGAANMSVKISNNDFIKEFDINGNTQYNLYMSRLINPSLIMNGDNIPEYKFEGKVIIKSSVQMYDDLSLLPLISKMHEDNINNYDSYYSLINDEHTPKLGSCIGTLVVPDDMAVAYGTKYIVIPNVGAGLYTDSLSNEQTYNLVNKEMIVGYKISPKENVKLLSGFNEETYRNSPTVQKFTSMLGKTPEVSVFIAMSGKTDAETLQQAGFSIIDATPDKKYEIIQVIDGSGDANGLHFDGNVFIVKEVV